MNRSFSVILHDYESNTTTTIENFTIYENAMFFIEEFIDNFIINLQGDKIYQYLFENPPFGTIFKDGFFVLKYQDHFNKFSVCRRFREIGWVANYQWDETKFDIFITTNQCKYKKLKTQTSVKQNCKIRDFKNANEFCLQSEFSKCLKCVDKDFQGKTTIKPTAELPAENKDECTILDLPQMRKTCL